MYEHEKHEFECFHKAEQHCLAHEVSKSYHALKSMEKPFIKPKVCKKKKRKKEKKEPFIL